LEVLFNDGNQDINGDRNPYLGLDGILRGPIKCLDPEMLFDPFEKSFDLPPEAKKLRGREARQHKVVG
jgi:hypothetical protein